jgi:hypothetical protein
MPSAIRLALEKAGYIDQNGQIKYMQESDESTQKIFFPSTRPPKPQTYPKMRPDREILFRSRIKIANLESSVKKYFPFSENNIPKPIDKSSNMVYNDANERKDGIRYG